MFSQLASYFASFPGIAIQSSNFSSNMEGISSEVSPVAAATATGTSSGAAVIVEFSLCFCLQRKRKKSQPCIHIHPKGG